MKIGYLDANEPFAQFATVVSQMADLLLPIHHPQYVDRVLWKNRPLISLSHRSQAKFGNL